MAMKVKKTLLTNLKNFSPFWSPLFYQYKETYLDIDMFVSDDFYISTLEYKLLLPI